MKISSKCDYAIRCLLELALRSEEKSVHIDSIARNQAIPLKFLQSIILNLKKGGFVDSKKGPGGGYSLVKSPSSISVADVIRYVEGPIELFRYENTAKTENVTKRILTGLWARLSGAIEKAAEENTIETLVREHQKMSKSAEQMFYI